jgi:hypothetical protein
MTIFFKKRIFTNFFIAKTFINGKWYHEENVYNKS